MARSLTIGAQAVKGGDTATDRVRQFRVTQAEHLHQCSAALRVRDIDLGREEFPLKVAGEKLLSPSLWAWSSCSALGRCRACPPAKTGECGAEIGGAGAVQIPAAGSELD